MKKVESQNYRDILAEYYYDLMTHITGKQTLDRSLTRDRLKQCGRALSAVSKLSSPVREFEFVRAVLEKDKPSLKCAA